jgi:pantothenate synthetase
MNRRLGIRRILFVALLPLVVLGLAVLVVKVYGLVRHDPAYFSEPYLERYATPSAVARDLELALQGDDVALLRERQGLRATPELETSAPVHHPHPKKA